MEKIRGQKQELPDSSLTIWIPIAMATMDHTGKEHLRGEAQTLPPRASLAWVTTKGYPASLSGFPISIHSYASVANTDPLGQIVRL